MFGTLSGLISMNGALWSCELQWPLGIADFQHKFQIFEAKHFLPSPLLKSYSGNNWDEDNGTGGNGCSYFDFS